MHINVCFDPVEVPVLISVIYNLYVLSSAFAWICWNLAACLIHASNSYQKLFVIDSISWHAVWFLCKHRVTLEEKLLAPPCYDARALRITTMCDNWKHLKQEVRCFRCLPYRGGNKYSYFPGWDLFAVITREKYPLIDFLIKVCSLL